MPKQPLKRSRGGKPAKTMKPFEETVRALMGLSSISGQDRVDDVVSLILDAPDPESAQQAIASRIQVESDVLARKWKDTIVSAWSHGHPKVPVLPHISLTESDVKDIALLRDVREFLLEIGRQPASMAKEGQEAVLEPDEALRLALVLPSWQGMPHMAIEHEWTLMPVRRLRMLLQTMGLIRVWQGKLTLVRSRTNLFMRFPAAQQFYALWHTDTYHLEWGLFAPAWQRYLNLIQGYLPMLWEIHSDVEEGLIEDATDWTAYTMDAFTPLWEQEGLLKGAGGGNLLHLYRELSLPAIIKKLGFDDIFVRYGLLLPHYDAPLGALIKSSEPPPSHYQWTSIAAKIIHAEHTSDLPCGIELLRS